MIEYLVPDPQLNKSSMELASTISENARRAVSASKYCVTVGLRDGFEAGLAAERELRIQTGRGPDALEGREAFIQKRKPKFLE
jgi:enoyl-CoA hydratase/carnithine racemase